MKQYDPRVVLVAFDLDEAESLAASATWATECFPNDPAAHAARYLSLLVNAHIAYGLAYGSAIDAIIEPYRRPMRIATPGAQTPFDLVYEVNRLAAAATARARAERATQAAG